jgi:hypothetical protein
MPSVATRDTLGGVPFNRRMSIPGLVRYICSFQQLRQSLIDPYEVS